MQYHWIEDIEEFSGIAKEWDEALVASGSYNPFLLSDFIVTWWRHFNDNLQLRIFVIYDNGRISGGLPLYLRRRGIGYFGIKSLLYIGDSIANYNEPFYSGSKTEILPLLKRALLDRSDWQVLSLPNVRSENGLISEYKNYIGDGQFLFYVIQDHSNFMIDLSAGKDNYLVTISRKLKKDIRRLRRHAVRDYGEIKLKQIKGREDVERHFDIYINFSTHAFNERNRKNCFGDEKYRSFFKEFLTIMDARDRLDAYVLTAGNKILAVIFGYRFGPGFNWVLTGFNYECRYVRPGYLLIEDLIDAIIRRGDLLCNCYGYESFYKGQWCNMETPLYRFFLIRRSLKGRFYNLLQEIVNILRSNRSLVNLTRKIKRS